MSKEKLLLQIVQYLIQENHYDIEIPNSYEKLKKLYKTLVNMRMPKPINEEILKLEDEYLKLELKDKKIIDVNNLNEIEDNIILWQGDITALKCDVIVNAGNHQGLGCFNPSHVCVDNVIHTSAGMRLRLECNEILKGNEISTGGIIVCSAYNLPSKKVITTVGPQVFNEVTRKNKIDLSNCYKNSLEYAIQNHYKSIAFPSISTGLFGYPIEKAKIVAYNSIKEILKKYKTDIKIILNVFSESDYNEYRKLFKN